jgi:hypothetical protein
MASDTRISAAELGEFHYARFILWAFVERQSKAQFGRNILVSRTEGNRAEIDQGLAFYVSHYKINLDELQNRVLELDEQGLTIAQIHEILQGKKKPEDFSKRGRKKQEEK